MRRLLSSPLSHAFLITLSSAAAQAGEYRFVRIADSRDGAFSLASDRQVVINNAGSVAFYASPAPGLNAGYFSGVGGAVSTIVTDAHPLLAGEGLALRSPSYNDSGQIAFFADRATVDGFRIYRADAGGALTLIASTGAGTFAGLQDRPSINNSGNVAFYESGVFGGAYIGNGLGNAKVYGTPDELQVIGTPSLNNLGTLSFPAQIGTGAGSDLHHLKGSAGITPTVIASGNTNGVSLFVPSVINDSGLVVFGGFVAGTTGIYSGAGASVITPLATLDGPYSNVAIAPGTGAGGFPTLNNAGSIAFVGNLDAGGNGIFTGADPATSGVIAGGTTLFGRSVVGFFGGLSREALNDAGEIAFQAQLLDGAVPSEVVVKAIPAIAMKWEDDSDGVWSDAANWMGPVPNAFHHDANFTDAITAPRTVTVDGAFTVGSINFDNANSYRLTGSGAIALYDSFGGAITSAGAAHTIDTELFALGATSVNVAGASLTLTNVKVDRTLNATVDLSKSGVGALRINKLDFDKVGIGAGKIQILAGGGTMATSKVKELNIAGASGAWTAQFDLNDSRAIIDYDSTTPIDQYFDQLKQGYAAGAWTGNGIASAAAAGDATGRTGVGFAEASDVLGAAGGVFGGRAVDGSAILLAYTLNGDTNLDRTVDIADFARLAANFNLPGVWTGGDFNYDGMIDIGDFAGLAANFNESLAIDLPRVSPAFAATGNSVPEPGAFAACAFAVRMLRRRRAA